MFILLAVVIGLAIGAARKGKVSQIRKNKISLWIVGLIGILLQILLHLYFYFGQAGTLPTFLNFASYVCILLMLIFNFDNIWMILMTVGTTANFVVAFINGGRMPVLPAIVKAIANAKLAGSITSGVNAIYAPLSKTTTALWMLGINVQIPYVSKITSYYGGIGGFSVGSVFVFVGLLGWLQHAMKPGKSVDPFSEELNEGKADYIISPDEGELIEDMAQKKKKGYETAPLDWLNQDSETLFAKEIHEQMGEEAPEEPVKKPAPKAQPKAKGPKKPASKPEAVPEAKTQEPPEKTTVLPDLSPELLERIKSHGTAPARKAARTPVSDDTRVFTTLKDLGKYDTKPIFKETPHRSAQTEAEDFAESGFFTQSFYTEREKGKLAFGSDEPQQPEKRAPRETLNNQEDKDQMADYQSSDGDQAKTSNTAKKPKAPAQADRKRPSESDSPRWEMPEKTKKTKVDQTAKKINPYRKYSDEEAARRADASRDNEKQMLDIWHQVSEDTRALRQRGRRSGRDDAGQSSPFEASEAERKRLKQQHNRAVIQRGENEIDADMQRKASTPKLQPSGEKVTDDEDREKIGFEKVEINVDNRKVSFWRKKKTK
ncbi:MAG: DUF5317 family protein [Pseudoramibacter sp.]